MLRKSASGICSNPSGVTDHSLTRVRSAVVAPWMKRLGFGSIRNGHPRTSQPDAQAQRDQATPAQHRQTTIPGPIVARRMPRGSEFQRMLGARIGHDESKHKVSATLPACRRSWKESGQVCEFEPAAVLRHTRRGAERATTRHDLALKVDRDSVVRFFLLATALRRDLNKTVPTVVGFQS
jgi:hypothetical protein